MIKFIKQLLGFGTSQETVKEIVTPPAAPATTSADVVVATATDNVPPVATYIEPAKPVNKVKALGESGAAAVKAATAPKPANKNRRQYRGNKNAGGTVAKVNQPKPAVTEGKTKGGNNVVKLQQPAKKPQAPKPAKKK